MTNHAFQMAIGWPPAHLRNYRVSCITQWAFGHALSWGCSKSANMRRGQGPRAVSAGQRAESQEQTIRARAAALYYSPFLYSLSKSKPQPKVSAYSAYNEQITVGTAVSPPGPGATNPVRNRLVAGMFDHFWAGYPNSPANYINFYNRLSNRDDYMARSQCHQHDERAGGAT